MSLECEMKAGQMPVYKSKNGKVLAVGRIEPQWIKLPPELGGRKVEITETFIARICKCGKHPAKVLILKRDYIVVECTNGYMWINKPDNIEEFKRQLQ